MSAPLAVAVIGARGRLGRFATELLQRSAGFELTGAWDSADDWRALVRSSGAQVALEATRAGQGAAHAHLLLERGVRVVVATSGVSVEESDALDAAARRLGLGGLVVPNFSLGSWLLQRFCEQAARWFDGAEIVELHHARKADAPSGTALETARRIARARRAAGQPPFEATTPGFPSRGAGRDGVPIHSVRLSGLYAHQEVLFGAPGELLSLRHDMSGPEAFGPGLLAALRYAARAEGVGRGIELALDAAARP